MSFLKKIVFYIGNWLIGLITYIAFIYLYVLLSFGEPISVFSTESLATLLIGAILFLGFNYFILKNEPKNNWWLAFAVVVISIVVMVSVVGY